LTFLSEIEMRKTDKPILLLYDFLAVKGGAERVLLALYQAMDSHVCVGFVSKESFKDDIKPEHLIDLKAFSRFPPLKIVKVLRGFLRAKKVAANYQTRIYAGSYSVLAFSPDHEGNSIYYCHTPPRFMYDLWDRYLTETPVWQRPLLRVLRWWLKPRYEAAVQGMDRVLANSKNVQDRLKRYVGVDATVVHPPVDVDLFQWKGPGDYFLSTARLEPLKRVDLIIQAFLGMPDQHLVVTSGGSEADRLRAMAGNASNIRFTGWLSDRDLADLMGHARASIYVPVDEDFGMSPVESMAAGKPVIGAAEGGLLETVIHGRTGTLLPPNFTPADLQTAVTAMTPQQAVSMRKACEEQARLFSRDRFFQD
jgi:glycosyltransferase involved in cell wall biosynthesis